MITIQDPSEVADISHVGISQIVSQRMAELNLSAGESLPDLGKFIVVEPSDTIAEIEQVSGCCITTDFYGEAHYGHPDFDPGHEWLEHHLEQHCFELVFITNDDGYFTVLLIPDDPGVDPDLLSLCRDYS